MTKEPTSQNFTSKLGKKKGVVGRKSPGGGLVIIGRSKQFPKKRPGPFKTEHSSFQGKKEKTENGGEVASAGLGEKRASIKGGKCKGGGTRGIQKKKFSLEGWGREPGHCVNQGRLEDFERDSKRNRVPRQKGT